MSVTHLEKKWSIGEPDHARVRDFAAQINLPPLLAQLLLQRGVDTPEAVHRFLNPSIGHLSDPYMLDDMAAAVERITRARANRERVLVFGDYDVDGISATVSC